VSIPVVAPIVITDERAFSGERLSDPGVARVSNFTTTDGTGVAITGASITLGIPRTGTYDIEAELSAQQRDSAATRAWALRATYGPTFNGLAVVNPHQVAVDSTGRVLIADRNNGRLLILTSDGAYSTSVTGLTSIAGVADNACGSTRSPTWAPGTLPPLSRGERMMLDAPASSGSRHCHGGDAVASTHGKDGRQWPALEPLNDRSERLRQLRRRTGRHALHRGVTTSRNAPMSCGVPWPRAQRLARKPTWPVNPGKVGASQPVPLSGHGPLRKDGRVALMPTSPRPAGGPCASCRPGSWPPLPWPKTPSSTPCAVFSMTLHMGQWQNQERGDRAAPGRAR